MSSKMNIDDEYLIVKMKQGGEFTQIKENPLRTYYTCVRYSHTNIGTPLNNDKQGTSNLKDYGPGQWSCMKGWFETYDNTFQGNNIDSKVLSYCKFRNTEEALKRDINDEFKLFILNNNFKS